MASFERTLFLLLTFRAITWAQYRKFVWEAPPIPIRDKHVEWLCAADARRLFPQPDPTFTLGASTNRR